MKISLQIYKRVLFCYTENIPLIPGRFARDSTAASARKQLTKAAK